MAKSKTLSIPNEDATTPQDTLALLYKVNIVPKKQPRYASGGVQINKLWYTHLMDRV